ncbi:MAG: glycosyl hydrolase family 38 [Phycisphaerae bacterium]|jgi:hypothetical protein
MTSRSLLCWLCSAGLVAAAAAVQDERPLPGYQGRIAGEVLKYHSPDPSVTSGLLVRSIDAERVIEWETQPLPADFNGDTASFVWLFGLDVNPAGRRFTLAVNGEPWFEFRNPPSSDVRDWTIAGPRGATLHFRATMVDRFGDLMGYAILRVPRAALMPGRTLRLRVGGESAGDPAWYITFQARVVEQAELTARPALLRDAGGIYQPLVLSVTHLGPPMEALVTTSVGAEQHLTLELGGNRVELRLPELAAPMDVTVRVRSGDTDLHVLTASVQPVRHWTINLVQHTHTDVGYTRPQTEILPEHVRFIDTALDLCDQTDSYPDEARFRWTCEASWPVREYLGCRTPEQIERLLRRVREGRIEITAMFLNMSEVMDETSYPSFLAPVRRFREAGLPVTTAMQDDVNGVAWCLADYFAGAGIEFLVMGQHGHRALIPFDRPTVFWWESPAGSRVLAFRADHYMTGNFWGVHTGRMEVVEDELLQYLANLERVGYPFDRVAVQHSGYATDNSPPSVASSELVRAWNERFVWPRLRCAVAREFPEWARRERGAELPVIRQAWTDWWTDGFGSAARESAAARVTQGRLVAVEGLSALTAAAGGEPAPALRAAVAEARDALIFWGEHTMGSAESIREPFCENSQVQWAEKSAYAWDAVKRAATLCESALGRLLARIDPADAPRLVVFNTLNFPRSAVLELYVDHALLPPDHSFRLVDENGEALLVQLLRSREEGSYWAIWARDVPAFGWREFRVEPAPPGAPPAPPRAATELENAHYRIVLDGQKGGIREWTDRSSGATLTDPAAEWLLGQLVYESLGNREQLEAFTLEKYARRSLEEVVAEGVVEGPIWSSLRFRGELPGCEGPGGARCEIRLFHPEQRLELHYTIQKRRVLDPEGIYVAFPFAPPQARIVYESLGGLVAPATDIIPRASSDWQAAQAFAAVRWRAAQVVVSSPEIPLFQFGDINTGKFQPQARIERAHLYSWVMNNYWTTNFCASQEGEFRWSYALASSTDTSAGFATRFGWGRRVPLLGRVLPGGGAARPLAQQSLLAFDAPNLILAGARQAAHGAGVILHLREVEGHAARLATSEWRFAGRPLRVVEVNALEDELAAVTDAVDFAPRQVKFLHLEPE